MNTLRTFFTLLAFSVPVLGICQDANIFNRINGVDFKGSIYVNIDKDRSFYYVIDREDDEHKITEDLFFKIRNVHKNDFAIYVQFYNPLSTSIKSTQKDLDDPANQAISSFLANLRSSPGKFAEGTKDKLSLLGSAVEFNETTLLNEWLYNFIQLIDQGYITNKGLSSQLSEVAGIVNGIENTEDFLYNTFLITDIDGQERTVNDWAKMSNEVLYKATNDYDDFYSALNEKSKKVSSEFSIVQSKASENLNRIIDLLTKDFDVRIKPLIAGKMAAGAPVARGDNEITAFKKYSSAAAKTLKAITKPQFTLHETVIQKLSDLNKKMDAFVLDYKNITKTVAGVTKHYKKDYSYMLDWQSTKMKSFTFDSQGLGQDGSEDTKSARSASFIVSKKLGVYPFVSTGVLFTNLSYPQYAVETNNGVSTVAKTDAEHVYVRPTAFLNMIISSWDPVYPFLQIGLSTGKSDVLVPVGLGLSFGSSFSFSTGCLFGYHKELNKLKIGGPVKDDAELQSDLGPKALFSPYFSLNYNIGKK